MKDFLIISLILLCILDKNNEVFGKIIYPTEEFIKIGDKCEDNSYTGTVQRFINCEFAVNNLKDSNIYPKIYYFDRFEPIICCNGSVQEKTSIIKSNFEFSNGLDGSTFKIETDKPLSTGSDSGPLFFELEEISCTTNDKRGVLSQFKECPLAIANLKNESIRPKIYTFKGLEPVVCCIKQETSVV